MLLLQQGSIWIPSGISASGLLRHLCRGFSNLLFTLQNQVHVRIRFTVYNSKLIWLTTNYCTFSELDPHKQAMKVSFKNDKQMLPSSEGNQCNGRLEFNFKSPLR